MKLFELFGDIFVDDDPSLKAISNVEKSAEGLGNRFSKVGKVVGGAMAATAAAVGASVGIIANKTFEATSEINKFSQVTGHSTDAFQKWDFVMKKFGFSMEQASGDIAALGEKALDAANGAGEGAELFGKLGVTVTDTSGKLKTQEQIFQETIIALQGMEDVTERNALASALLSTTGEELVPVLNMTAEELENVKSKADIISEDQLKQAAKFKEGWDEITNTFSVLVVEVGLSVLPILNKFFGWLQEHMPQIKSIAKTVFGAISDSLEFIVKIFNENVLPVFNIFKDWLDDNMPAIKSTFNNVFGFIFSTIKDVWEIIRDNLFPIFVQLWEWLDPHLPKIQTLFETVFIGIAKSIEAVVLIFDTLTTGIKTAFEWLDKWNNAEVGVGAMGRQDLKVGTSVNNTYNINTKVDSDEVRNIIDVSNREMAYKIGVG